MLSTSRCAHCLDGGGLFTSLCITLLLFSPALLLSFCFYFWLKILLDYFNTFSVYPVGSQFEVERITSVNTFPFGTKLQSHSPVKEGLDKKIVSSTPSHLRTHPLPLITLPSPFPLVFSQPFLPRLIPCSSFSIFCLELFCVDGKVRARKPKCLAGKGKSYN